MQTSRQLKLLVAALALAASGCGGGGEQGGGGDQGGDGAAPPGLVLDVGGLGDKSFNDSANVGLERAQEEFGVEGEYLESQAPTDYANNITQLAENGSNPVIAVGFLMTEDLTNISPQFPDTQFAIVDSVVETDNVISLVFREQEGSFLAGVVAGLMTQEDTEFTTSDEQVVGFIGGQEGPLIEKFEAGYIAGVESVCPDCEVLSQYAGSTPDAFNDPQRGGEISQQQIEQGADVIYHASGNTGSGLFEVAGEEGVFAIGVDQDQAKQFPEAPILTSVVKRVDNAVYETIQGVSEGGAPKGEIVDRGLAEEGISLAPFGRFDDQVPQEVKDAVDEARQGIIDGDVKAPDKLQ